MAEENLREFLKEQAKSLDGLLALTPAKMMFGEDVSDQWKRKKQTPEQKRAARKAKLDPANWKSAKDVYDEREAEALKKRKRETGETEEAQVDKEQTDEGSGQPATKKLKSNKAEKHASLGSIVEKKEDESVENANLKKRAKKRANKLKKKEEDRLRKKEKREQKALEKKTDSSEVAKDTVQITSSEKQKKTKPVKESSSKKQKVEAIPKDNTMAAQDEDLMQVDDFSALQEIEDSTMLPSEDDEEATKENASDNDDKNVEEEHDDGSEYSTVASSEADVEIFSPPQDSAASSVSSIPPPLPLQPKKTDVAAMSSLPQGGEKSTSQIQPITETERKAARERLQQQISQFRTQRKADEKAPRSRAELLEQRKRQEEERKAAKKEQRRKDKENEARQQEEEMVRRFSPGGSGSLLGSPRSPMAEGGGNAFSFGRIAFEDGTRLDSNAMSVAAERKRKGPQDAATALKAAQSKEARIAGLDEQKKKDIQEKDMWLQAKRKAFGEKVKDDTSLLKKALKRQEKQKHKSGGEWDKRIEGVKSAQEARQKKRTDNLQARKDTKMANKTGKKVKRPGFEGSFRGRSGKGKKK